MVILHQNLKKKKNYNTFVFKVLFELIHFVVIEDLKFLWTTCQLDPFRHPTG